MSDNTNLNERVGWVDIPVGDVRRAASFYEAMLDIAVSIERFGEYTIGVLEHGPGNGGCLVEPQEEGWKPSHLGLLVYFSVEGRIRDAVAKVQSGGGQVLEDVHPIGPHGFRALVVDSEGNRIALHSNNDA